MAQMQRKTGRGRPREIGERCYGDGGTERVSEKEGGGGRNGGQRSLKSEIVLHIGCRPHSLGGEDSSVDRVCYSNVMRNTDADSTP